MSATFLEIAGVRKSYGDVAALADCTISIERGEFVTLLGPSGCGKTTTLRMIAGFIQPDAGTIRLRDRILSSASVHVPPEQRDMGMVFQSYAVWPHMTVRQNIALPLKLRGLRKTEIDSRIEEILATCQLGKFAEREPHQLSGGQLQRVALARALVYRPQVVLLDEPLSNLDVALREELRRELHQVHKKIGGTFILVTHDQVEAMSLSDRVVVMREGRIEQIGTPNEIYRNPKTPFVAQFVGAANVLAGTVVSATGTGPADSCEVDFGAMRLSVRSWPDAAPGRRLNFAIHPEAVRLSAGGGDSALQGTVKATYFLGRTQEIVVELGGSELHSVQVRGEAFTTGDRVSVRVAGDAVLPLADTA